MDTYKCNYHMHSYYSDGAYSPEELVRKHCDEEYDVIALTDHDGIEGIREFLESCESHGIRGVTGIEFSTELELDGKEYELHILGYGFDPENAELKETCSRLRVLRHERNEKLFAALNELGFCLDLEEIEERSKGRYVGKPDIARELVRKGILSEPKEAFTEKVFERPEIKAIRKVKLSSEEAIRLITGAGGTAFLAHPAKIRELGEKRGSEEFFEEIERILTALRKVGLKGLECIYPEHTEEERFRFIQLAGKYHLHISSGTDFHGDDM
ncbi:MAG: PHP domain-containing protein [Clostridia bacterium]|nr:PHP domain-containing protein [Clostridia bacterium]